MAKMAGPPVLGALLDRLAALPVSGSPYLSLYLDARPDQRGRAHFEPFLRKALAEEARRQPPRSDGLDVVEALKTRLRAYLDAELQPASDTVAAFGGGPRPDFFEAAQLDEPIDGSEVALDERPYVVPLARLEARHPAWAVLAGDTREARVVVFGVDGEAERTQVTGESLPRTQAGGWSQARFQRHVDDHHQHHARQAVAALERLARAHAVRWIVLAGDDVMLQLVGQELPKPLAARVAGSRGAIPGGSDEELRRHTQPVMEARQARDDDEVVSRLLDAWRSGGPAVGRAPETLAALERGQVDELVIDARAGRLAGEPGDSRRLANVLVLAARRTRARLRFVEDGGRLSEVAGVGGLLRYPT